MLSLQQDLQESLRTGFIDQTHPSKKEYLPQLLLNDKQEGKKILTTLHQELRQCEAFWFSAAFVTQGGVAVIKNVLQELKQKGIKGKILVSQYLNFTQPEALKSLLQFSNIDLRIVEKGAFHAKGYLFKNGAAYNLIVGSSNLTDTALCSNKEWNLKVTATAGSSLIIHTISVFEREFNMATKVDALFLSRYEQLYKAQQQFIKENNGSLETGSPLDVIQPNVMQQEALQNLQMFRGKGIKKALLISATGTGKTYLSAFDVKEVRPKKFLFLVHRANIAAAALRSFRKIIDPSKTLGMYTGDQREREADYLFSTVQTLSRDKHMYGFEPTHFDYIVIDETHRSGADSYQKILSHFQPHFLLGMTATPERTDGFDIFRQFDYNIAYEIRLQRALEEEMLCTFHYYGVADISVDGKVIQEEAGFNLLLDEERVNRILEKALFYSCDNGQVRGLVFCSQVDEAKALSEAFNKRGYKTLALSGDNNEAERARAINSLESHDEDSRLDYIFTVDIFNEGVDIPKVNQIIMLRPTQSAIVFVQQLGRGLRKTDDKEYLTVIDFIGNYTNNYLIPIALLGDTSYNKDRLRKLMASGSSLIPGASTVNFDPITRDRIFAAIDSAKLSLKKDLDRDYDLLKFKLGRRPMMMDFIEHGSRDPFLYVKYADSYFNFVAAKENALLTQLSAEHQTLLELFCTHIADAKRVEEVHIMQALLTQSTIAVSALKAGMLKKYGAHVSDDTIQSCLLNLNFQFINVPKKVVLLEQGAIKRDQMLDAALLNPCFYDFLEDALQYAETTFDMKFKRTAYIDGFLLYEKYTRKDVLRILNWDKNQPPLNVGGYVVHPKKTCCPIFVTYKKREEITHSIKYEDKFLNNYEFQMLSKPKRTLKSPEIVLMREAKNGIRLPLFIQKSNDEGVDFYYMGDVIPKENGFKQDVMPGPGGVNVIIVTITFLMQVPVQDAIYEYITLEANQTSPTK